MIKLIVNDVELDLKSDTVVALTKKAAEIGNLQNRWSSYTNKFNVPASKKNRDALGLKQFQDASGSQYEYQNGKLISGGLEIASNVLVIIESVSQDITLTLRAGNGSLFDAMNKTKLSDLSWDDLNHRWFGSDFLYKNNSYTSGYVYPVHQTGGQSLTKNTNLSSASIPFIYVKSTFERIADYFGYTWSGDTYTLDMFEKLSYPIANNDIDADFANEFIYDTDLDYHDFDSNIRNNFVVYPLRLTVINDPKLRHGTFNFKFVNGTVPGEGYIIPYKGIYTCELTYNVSYRNASGVSTDIGIEIALYDVLSNSISVYKKIVFPAATTTLQTASGTVIFDLDFEGDLTYLNRYFIVPQARLGTVKGLAQYTVNSGEFKITHIQGDKISFGTDWQIKFAQPDKTIGAFIKEVGNIFAAIYDVDEFKKTIEITRFDEIAENKSIAYDWSDKLDLNQDITVTYKLDGLGKVTKWQWSEDIFYSKSLNIANDQLPEISEYIKSSANYSESASILTYPDPVISIPYWDGQKIVTDGNLRFALIKNGASYQLKFGLTGTASSTYKVAYFDYTNSPYSLDWSYLYDTYFADLLDPMTDRLQVVECYMKLNDLDIQSFKFKIPVYVKRFNRYFFVNEISEYTGKTQSTKVILVGI